MQKRHWICKLFQIQECRLTFFTVSASFMTRYCTKLIHKPVIHLPRLTVELGFQHRKYSRTGNFSWSTFSGTFLGDVLFCCDANGRRRSSLYATFFPNKNKFFQMWANSNLFISKFIRPKLKKVGFGRKTSCRVGTLMLLIKIKYSCCHLVFEVVQNDLRQL